MNIERDTLDERILKVLLQKYPITLSQLCSILKIREQTLKVKLLAMQNRGILTLEVLPDEVFIRLLRTDFNFEGISKKQKRAVKKERTGGGVKKEEKDDVMYG